MSDALDHLTTALADWCSTDRHVGVGGRARVFLGDSGIKRCGLLLIIGSLLLPLGCGGNDDINGPDYATLVITTTSLPNAAPTVPYSETLVATGGDSTYTWSVTVGSLPTGLSLTASTGLISGTPTVLGSETFTVEVASGDGQTDTRQLMITVELRVLSNLSGLGVATLDGVMAPGEWAGAGCLDFMANVTEGGTTPATWCVMNDDVNLYLSVRFRRSVVDRGNSASFEFDNDHDGVAENGDDAVVMNPAVGFFDDFRTNAPPCTAGSPPASCGFLDTDHGGTSDGAGAFANDGMFSVYELSHPLNSADNAHDFSLMAGDTVGAFLGLTMILDSGLADTRVPPTGYIPIIILFFRPLTLVDCFPDSVGDRILRGLAGRQ